MKLYLTIALNGRTDEGKVNVLFQKLKKNTMLRKKL